MSGWERGYSCAAFGLTATKGAYWHGRCDCGAATLDDLWRRHLEPAGFERLSSPSPNLLVVTRGDLVARRGPVLSEGPVFDALRSLSGGGRA